MNNLTKEESEAVQNVLRKSQAMKCVAIWGLELV
jgi:hypothetical protein